MTTDMDMSLLDSFIEEENDEDSTVTGGNSSAGVLDEVFDDFSSNLGSVTIYSEAGKLATRENRLDGKSMEKSSLAEKSGLAWEENLIQSSSMVVGLTGYSVSAIDPEVKVKYIEVINRILVRENALINVRKIAMSMDVLYWKYSVNRIRIFHYDRDRSAKRQLDHLVRCQEELTVAIAHYRSATMDCITKIHKYKMLCKEKHGTEESVVVLWRGMNYLLKMNKDIISLQKSHTIRLWLGFVPNALMQPPEDHDPHAAHHPLRERYHDWHVAHKAHRRKIGKNFAPISFVLSDIELEEERMEYAALDRAGENEMNGDDGAPPAEEKEDEEEVTEGDDATRVSTLKGDTDKSLVEEEESIGAVSIIIPDADWMGLRNYSEPIWTDAAEEFWSCLDWDPKAVHAAIGFPEAFPHLYLVPPLPNRLVQHCRGLRALLYLEKELVDSQVAKAKAAAELKDMVTATVTPEMLASIAAGGRNREIATNLIYMRSRQEGGNGGVSLEKSIQRIASEAMIAPPPIEDPVDEEELFMTGLDGPQPPPPVKRIRGSAPVTPMVMDSRRLSDTVETKVASGRNITVRHGNHLVIRPNMRRQDAGKPIPMFDIFQACMIIQKLGRVFLNKRKAAVQARLRARDKAARQLQRVSRGIQGRARYAAARKEFNTEYMVLRKILVRKEIAAFVVTRFMRKAAFVYRKAREMANLDDIIGEGRRKLVVRREVVRYDAAATVIGRCWRGRMGRLRFWMAARGVFLTAKHERHAQKKAAAAMTVSMESDISFGPSTSMTSGGVSNDKGTVISASESANRVGELNRLEKERRSGHFVPEDYQTSTPIRAAALLLAKYTCEWMRATKKDSEAAYHTFKLETKSAARKKKGHGKKGFGITSTAKVADVWPIACSWPYALRPAPTGGSRGGYSGLLARDDDADEERKPLHRAVTMAATALVRELPVIGQTMSATETHFTDTSNFGQDVSMDETNAGPTFLTSSASLDNISLGSSNQSVVAGRTRRIITRAGLSGRQLVAEAKKTMSGMRDPVGGSRLLPNCGRTCGGGKMLSSLPRTFVNDPREVKMAPNEREEVYVSPCLEDYVKRARAKKAFAKTQSLLNPPPQTISREERLGNTLRKVLSHSSFL